MRDILAAHGYRVVGNPTEGPNPVLTPERLMAEGLNPRGDPDDLVENRVFDTYTPVVDDPKSVVSGMRAKVEDKQAFRLTVDLRGTTQTQSAIRAELRRHPIPGLQEVILITREGLQPPFRP